MPVPGAAKPQIDRRVTGRTGRGHVSRYRDPVPDVLYLEQGPWDLTADSDRVGDRSLSRPRSRARCCHGTWRGSSSEARVPSVRAPVAGYMPGSGEGSCHAQKRSPLVPPPLEASAGRGLGRCRRCLRRRPGAVRPDGSARSGRGTRPQYSQFGRPAFAPPGAAFPAVWSALNLTTATSAWCVWRAPEPAAGGPSRGEVLAWWTAAVVIRSGYVPLAFGQRRLWAATADAALLFAVMARYALLARRIDQPAALLAVPEVAWTAFATVLSTTVAAINS